MTRTRRGAAVALALFALGGCAGRSDPVRAGTTAVTVAGPATAPAPPDRPLASSPSPAPAATRPVSSSATPTTSATTAATTTAAPAPSAPTAASRATTTTTTATAERPPVTTGERPVPPVATTAPPPPTSSTIAPLVPGQEAYGYLVGVRPGPVVLIDVVERFTGVEARRAAAADGVTLPAGQDVYVRNRDAEPSPFRILPGAAVLAAECTDTGCLRQPAPLDRLPIGTTRLSWFVPDGGDGLSELVVPVD